MVATINACGRGILILFVFCVGSASANTPSKVAIGLKIEQITGIDQKHENFSVVAALRVNWQHDGLRYAPEQDESVPRAYTLSSFRQLVESAGIRWPELTLTNAQGRVNHQTQIAQIHPDGSVNYFERFTATFQAPHFNFRRFPFDRQRFAIHIDSVLSSRDFVFEELPGISGVGSALGEEEWVVTKVAASTTRDVASGFENSSRFTLELHANRHLDYYVIRILIPIALIVTVSWFTFFLKDYLKRIDFSGTNLLLFIAFNFTVSHDLPRLGYLTLIDVVMVGTFIITGLAILINVILRRLETIGKGAMARRLDVFAIIGYPVAYMIGAAYLAFWMQ